MSRTAYPTLALCFSFATAIPTIGAAASPLVTFDVPATIACQEVTSEDFARNYPGEKLVEFVVDVSTFASSPQAEDLVELQFKAYCDRALGRVHHYEPQTQLEPLSVGSVSVEKRTESARSFGLSTGGISDKLKFGGEVDFARKDSELKKYDAPAAVRQIAASGTLHRGRAAFFKFAPSNAWSLEGNRQVLLQLRVPQNWRGGPLTLDCESSRIKPAMIESKGQRQLVGRQRFTIALYMAGDVHAKQTGNAWLQSERSLRKAAIENEKAIRKASYPKTIDRIALFVGAAEPKIPADWLNRIISQSLDDASARWTNLLPAPVSEATSRYLLARHEFQLLSVGTHSPVMAH